MQVFTVDTQLYCSINHLHVSTAVLLPTSGDTKGISKGEIIQLERSYFIVNTTGVTHIKAVFTVLDPRTSSMSHCVRFRAERNRSFPPWMLRLHAVCFMNRGRNYANDANA